MDNTLKVPPVSIPTLNDRPSNVPRATEGFQPGGAGPNPTAPVAQPSDMYRSPSVIPTPAKN